MRAKTKTAIGRAARARLAIPRRLRSRVTTRAVQLIAPLASPSAPLQSRSFAASVGSRHALEVVDAERLFLASDVPVVLKVATSAKFSEATWISCPCSTVVKSQRWTDCSPFGSLYLLYVVSVGDGSYANIFRTSPLIESTHVVRASMLRTIGRVALLNICTARRMLSKHACKEFARKCGFQLYVKCSSIKPGSTSNMKYACKKMKTNSSSTLQCSVQASSMCPVMQTNEILRE